LPFGEELVATGTTDKHRFTSYERDGETGTDYAVNRYYNSAIAVFASADPIADMARTKYREPQIGQESVKHHRDNINSDVGSVNRALNDVTALEEFLSLGSEDIGECVSRSKKFHDGEFLNNPQNWNSYSYTMNDPLNWIDPSGLCRNPIAFRQCIRLGIPPCLRLRFPALIALCVVVVTVGCYVRWCEPRPPILL
jgi:RHS repeat-associated protein